MWIVVTNSWVICCLKELNAFHLALKGTKNDLALAHIVDLLFVGNYLVIFNDFFLLKSRTVWIKSWLIHVNFLQTSLERHYFLQLAGNIVLSHLVASNCGERLFLRLRMQWSLRQTLKNWLNSFFRVILTYCVLTRANTNFSLLFLESFLFAPEISFVPMVELFYQFCTKTSGLLVILPRGRFLLFRSTSVELVPFHFGDKNGSFGDFLFIPIILQLVGARTILLIEFIVKPIQVAPEIKGWLFRLILSTIVIAVIVLGRSWVIFFLVRRLSA